MAQQVGIPEFYVGAEFSRFQTLSYWNGLDQALRQVYKGKLMYANNGSGVHSGEGGDSVTRSADAYPDLNVPDNVTVRRLTRRWEAYDRRLPARTALSEVGISGVRGAFKVPWQHHWPHPGWMSACRPGGSRRPAAPPWPSTWAASTSGPSASAPPS